MDGVGRRLLLSAIPKLKSKKLFKGTQRRQPDSRPDVIPQEFSQIYYSRIGSSCGNLNNGYHDVFYVMLDVFIAASWSDTRRFRGRTTRQKGGD